MYHGSIQRRAYDIPQGRRPVRVELDEISITVLRILYETQAFGERALRLGEIAEGQGSLKRKMQDRIQDTLMRQSLIETRPANDGEFAAASAKFRIRRGFPVYYLTEFGRATIAHILGARGEDAADVVEV